MPKGKIPSLGDHCFSKLQENIRKNGDKIYSHLIYNYYRPLRPKNFKPRCVFCCSDKKITKEHIIPKWLIVQSKEPYFTSMINYISFDYNKATVPACSICNNQILGGIEKHISNRFNELGIISKPISTKDIEVMIKWLEIIDYKLQVMNVIQRFIVLKGTQFDSRFANIPQGFCAGMQRQPRT